MSVPFILVCNVILCFLILYIVVYSLINTLQYHKQKQARSSTWVLNILTLFLWMIRVQTMENCSGFVKQTNRNSKSFSNIIVIIGRKVRRLKRLVDLDVFFSLMNECMIDWLIILDLNTISIKAVKLIDGYDKTGKNNTYLIHSNLTKACFKRRGTAVLNWLDWSSTAAWR